MDLIVTVVYDENNGRYMATCSELDIWGEGDSLSEALEEYAYYLDNYIQDIVDEDPSVFSLHLLEQREILLSMMGDK